MKLNQIIPLVVSAAFLAGCIFVLWAIIRFSIISPRRTRGWQQRLSKPNLAEVESKWDIRLPRSLELLFQSDLVRQTECYLAPPGGDETTRWYIAQFIPITSQDLSEWIKVTRVPGIPIAIDGSKGTYYLPFSDLQHGKPPAVLLRPAGRNPMEKVIARTVDDFASFRRTATDEGN
jgi:hypothetical protein